MGAMKEMWMARQEEICERYCFEKETREDAVQALIRLGFNRDEAETMLDEAAQ